MNRLNFIPGLAVAFVLIALDQWLKFWARTTLIAQGASEHLNGFFVLQYAENSGAFLGLGGDWPTWLRTLIFVVFVAGFLAYLTWTLLTQKHHVSEEWALWLFLSGGLGNLIDRVWFGYVIDYALIIAGPLRTGIFNLADSVIVVAFLLILYSSFRNSQQSSETK